MVLGRYLIFGYCGCCEVGLGRYKVGVELI